MPLADRHAGNKYVSLNLTITAGAVDYWVAGNNPAEFPDYNLDWDERDWWNTLVIKNLSVNQDFSIKLNRMDQTEIWIRGTEDIPAIFDDFIFRDVYISNPGLQDESFDLIFFSAASIIGEPKRPTELKAVEATASSVKLSFRDNTMEDDYFIVERSSTSITSGYITIDQIRFSNFNQTRGKLREYTDSSVLSGVTYWYRIYSVRNNLFSKPSDPIEVITL